MSGFLTSQECECCNGKIPRCKCEATMTPCLFNWTCFHPRDNLHIPADKPHKIRLVRNEGSADTILFETSLSSGSWRPPYEHLVPTTYRLEVCCAADAYYVCEWSLIKSITLNGAATGCPPCFPIAPPACKYVKTEGSLRETATLTIELNGNTFPAAGGISTDWSGIYAMNLTQHWTGPCLAELFVAGDTRTFTSGFSTLTESDILSIKWYGGGAGNPQGSSSAINNIVILDFHTSNPLGGVLQRYAFNSNQPYNTLLTPGYSNCEGLILGIAAEVGFSGGPNGRFPSHNPDRFPGYYPTGYNSIVEINRQ